MKKDKRMVRYFLTFVLSVVMIFDVYAHGGRLAADG